MYGCVVYAGYYTTIKSLGVLSVCPEEKKVPDTFRVNMDSGVDINNPDLASRWRGGSNSWYDVHGQHPVTPFDAAGISTGHGT
jgi:hypothetical protein